MARTNRMMELIFGKGACESSINESQKTHNAYRRIAAPHVRGCWLGSRLERLRGTKPGASSNLLLRPTRPKRHC